MTNMETIFNTDDYTAVITGTVSVKDTTKYFTFVIDKEKQFNTENLIEAFNDAGKQLACAFIN